MLNSSTIFSCYLPSKFVKRWIVPKLCSLNIFCMRRKIGKYEERWTLEGKNTKKHVPKCCKQESANNVNYEIMKLAKELSVDVHRSSSVYYGLLQIQQLHQGAPKYQKVFRILFLLDICCICMKGDQNAKRIIFGGFSQPGHHFVENALFQRGVYLSCSVVLEGS